MDSDLIVSPSSAYLPWAHNIVIKGNHHSLAKRLDEQSAVINFLIDGTLPVAQPAPLSRDVWLRFIVDGKVVRLSEANVKSFDARGLPNKEYTLCCELRSGINSQAGYKTPILDALEPGNSYAFMPYGGRKPFKLSSEQLMQAPQPVSMFEFDVDATSAPAVTGSDQESEKPAVPLPQAQPSEVQPAGMP